MVETFLAQAAGNLKHTAAGAWEFMGGDARALRESADDNQVFANTRDGVSGAILRGAGDVVGTLAGSPSGKLGWILSAVRGLANSYSQTLAETGDREEARRALIAEAPWLAVYAVAGRVGAKEGKLLLPKNPGPLLKSAAAFGGEAISSISVGTVRSIVEGKEYGLQQLTADTLIAYFQARGSYKIETSAAGKDAAKQELSRRGFSEEQIATPSEAGPNTPAEIVKTANPDDGSQAQSKGKASGRKLTTAELQKLATQYADLVNSNKYWDWDLDVKNGYELTQKQKTSIKREAIRLGLIANVKRKPGTKYADFEGAGVVLKKLQLPPELWKFRDGIQFKWLDRQLPGGRPPGTTWHHSEIPGMMELVPYGLHRIFGHWGGRSKGNWSEGSR